MIFDPIKNRQFAEKEVIRLYKTDFDNTGPMGNVAMMQLGSVIGLWLVGFDEETRDILPKLSAYD